MVVTDAPLGVFLAIVGYLLWAATNVVDKRLLTGPRQTGLGFALLANLLIFVASLPLAGRDVFDLSIYAFLLSAAAGIAFFVGLCLYFAALRLGSVATIVPLTGLAAASALVVSFLVFGNLHSPMDMLGAATLVVGGIFLGRIEHGERSHRVSVLLVAGSTIALGCSYAIQVELYREALFFAGFACVRAFAFLASLSLLLSKSVRDEVLSLTTSTRLSTGLVFIGNQVLGFIGLLLINGALVYTSAVVVSALAAVQYAVVAMAGFFEARLGLADRGAGPPTSSLLRNLGLMLILVGTVLVAF